MDKNTITGLLLMALLLFGFMWLRPKNEGAPTSPQEEKEQAVAAASQEALAADSISEQDMEWLRKNISANGTEKVLDNGRHVYTYNDGRVDLTLNGDSIYGSVAVGNKTMAFNDIVNADTTKMTVKEQRQAVEAVRAMSLSLGKYGPFSKFTAGTDSVIKLSNDVLALQFSTKSGSITRAELKDYNTEYTPDETKKAKNPVVLFEGNSNLFDLELPYTSPVNTAQLYFTPREVTDSTVLMALNFDGDAFWGIKYTLHRGKSYIVSMDIVQKGMDRIIQSNNTNLILNWHQNLRRQEKGKVFEERNSAIYFKELGGSVEHLSENKNDEKDVTTKIKWIGFKNQFFSSVVINRNAFAKANFNSEIANSNLYLKNFNTSATVADYRWGNDRPASFDIFLGPNLYPLLSDLDKQVQTDEDLKLTKMIPLGWSLFRWINTLIIIPVFNFLGSFISNYGVIILLLTIFIKLILFPFTWKSYKSQAKMRVLAPDIKAINERYPGNENMQKRQQKTMELYRKAGASPMSGCLPMLLQMPILFAMFTFFPSCIELRGESFLWAHDLSAPDAIISWNANIPIITRFFGNHISLFCLLMTVTNIIYTRINMQNSASTMPGMKWMMYLMPVFFMIFFNNYASGLSYYYFLSLLITIVQTYCFRFFIKEDAVRAEMAANAKKPKKQSKFMARLEQMQKEQQRMLEEQKKRKK